MKLPVVGRAEDGDAFPVVIDGVALFLDFMASNDHVEIVGVQKVLGDIWPKLQANAAFRRRATKLRLRIRPQHLTHQSYNQSKLKKLIAYLRSKVDGIDQFPATLLV
jgi:hypothetical protein